MSLEDAYWCRTNPNKKYLDKNKVKYNHVKSWSWLIQLFHHVKLQKFQITVLTNLIGYSEVFKLHFCTPACCFKTSDIMLYQLLFRIKEETNLKTCMYPKYVLSLFLSLKTDLASYAAFIE